jgi:hypothetical protein
MSLTNAQSAQAGASQTQSEGSSKGNGIVYGVILDETHPYVKNNDNAKDKESSFIGAVLFRYAGQISKDEASLPIAYPFDKNFKTLPVRNESVEIIEGKGGQLYYRRIGQEVSLSANNDPNVISGLFAPKKLKSEQGEDYSKVQETGIARSNSDESTKYDGYGDYYEFQQGIHKLKLYEGDTLFESRFGQSIRFSGYNNLTGQKRIFSPTIIIRNNENAESKKKEFNLSTEEDINRDGSIIALTSNQYQLPFLPGTVNDKGSTDFETKPESFENYPQKLIGEQILLNSDRIILSAKKAEIIFFSKKNYGFISDGSLSIDNKGGIDVSVKDNIHIVTNDRDVAIHSGKGSIFLGNENLEPIVKGQQLVDLLAELIDAIVAQNYLTPSGPTKIGPENVPTFRSIKSKLNNILSKLNQTS